MLFPTQSATAEVSRLFLAAFLFGAIFVPHKLLTPRVCWDRCASLHSLFNYG